MSSGFVAIRTKQRRLHMYLMMGAVVASGAFLFSYLIYHFAYEAKTYTGSVPTIYYSILISHVLLAACVPFLVGFVILKAVKGQLETHRRVARKVLVIWAYVSLTGVVVYWFVHL